MTAEEVRLPDTRTLGDSWGLGWIRYGWDAERLLGHDGNTLGQAAFLRVLPSRGIAVALLANGGHTLDLSRDLFGEVFAELAGVELPPPLAPAADPVADDPAAYVGRYERAGLATEVFEGADGLVLRSTITGPLAELLPEPVHEYALAPVEPGVYAMRAPGHRDLDRRHVLRARGRRALRPLRRARQPARRSRLGCDRSEKTAGARSPSGARDARAAPRAAPPGSGGRPRLPVEVDRERDQPAGRDAAEEVPARLTATDEHDEQLLPRRRRIAALPVHPQLGPAVARRSSPRAGRRTCCTARPSRRRARPAPACRCRP